MPPHSDHQRPPGLTAAADGSHTQGGMIALMPTAEDAERLAIPGGEPAEELHLTLFFLGDDGSAYTEDQRDELEGILRPLAELYGLGPVRAKAFGAAHWNGDGDYPCWVWNVGDAEPGEHVPLDGLLKVRACVTEALESTHARPGMPPQHSPWAAHVCAAYSDDPAILPELEQRLGELTFDRIRLSFGDEDRDIPLTGDAVTAAAGPLRREPTELETASHADFASVHAEWEAATAGALGALKSTTAAWRLDLREQITRDLADGDIDALLGLSLDRQAATSTLLDLMEEFAVKAGRACQREAEAQGVRVPDWSLPDDEDDAVTAALAGRRLLTSVAELVSDLMSGALLTAAKRKLSGLLRSSRPSEQIAAEVDRELSAVDDSSVRAAVGQAMTAAQNAGRGAVMEAAPPASSYVASEILDSRTCGPCKAIDGRTFTTLDAAVAEYPVMGYQDCTGARYGNACRGFIIAVWQEVQASATTAAARTSDGCVFHGTPGRPSYRKYHPSGRNKKNESRGKTRHAKGGMLGSDRYTEAEHEDAMLDYTGRGYRDMNAYLRSDTPPQRDSLENVRKQISTLTDLIDIQDPTTSEMTLWRGTRQLRIGLKEGDEFHDRGFVSTADEPDLPRSFTGVGGSLFRIRVPAGAKLMNVASVGGDTSENEFVLPPGTKFRVVKANEPDDPLETAEYEVEVING